MDSLRTHPNFMQAPSGQVAAGVPLTHIKGNDRMTTINFRPHLFNERADRSVLLTYRLNGRIIDVQPDGREVSAHGDIEVQRQLAGIVDAMRREYERGALTIAQASEDAVAELRCTVEMSVPDFSLGSFVPRSKSKKETLGKEVALKLVDADTLGACKLTTDRESYECLVGKAGGEFLRCELIELAGWLKNSTLTR